MGMCVVRGDRTKSPGKDKHGSWSNHTLLAIQKQEDDDQNNRAEKSDTDFDDRFAFPPVVGFPLLQGLLLLLLFILCFLVFGHTPFSLFVGDTLQFEEAKGVTPSSIVLDILCADGVFPFIRYLRGDSNSYGFRFFFIL